MSPGNSAQSTDGVIEATERTKDADMPFLLGVQWHPERMPYDSALSGGIAKHFFKAMRGTSNG